MRLAIVRHGKAEHHSDSGADRDRRLRPRGEAQARWLAQRFSAGDWRPGLILASPFERAISTARLIQAAAGAPLVAAHELECDEPVARALDLLLRQDGAGPLMLVGHNPQLSRLIAALVQGPTARAPELRTGEAALLQLDGHIAPGAAALVDCWRLEPEGD